MHAFVHCSVIHKRTLERELHITLPVPGLFSENNTKNYQSVKGHDLRACKYTLYDLTIINAKAIKPGEKKNAGHTKDLSGRNADLPDAENYIFFVKKRNAHSYVFGKGYSYHGYYARLYHGKNCPAVNKRGKRAISAFQVNELPARVRHHARQFPVAKCGEQSYNSADDPADQHPERRSKDPHHVCAYNKDPRAYHASRDNHDRIKEIQAAF